MMKFKKTIAVVLSVVMMLSAGSMPIAVNAATIESSSAVAEQTGVYNLKERMELLSGTDNTNGYAEGV